MNISRRYRIFISSVQKEFAEERQAIKAFIASNPLTSKYFDVFLFEDVPAKDCRADKVYLEEVERCDLYMGLFGNTYGYEGQDGVSPTEKEFDCATEKAKPRIILVKGADDSARQQKMLALIRKAGDQLTRRRFIDTKDLTEEVFSSLVNYLEESGAIHTGPYDAAACLDANLADISEEKVSTFLAHAQKARGYAFGPDTPVRDALAHLNLLNNDNPSNAAILLFGMQPQRRLPSSEVKCMHFHSQTIRKPIPSYQVYKGDLFQLVDAAIDFVMGKLDRSVGTRSQTNDAPVAYEIPREAVAEAIVNAIAHRDYKSSASVQVMLFSDRLEVWNPGCLPPELTIESLRRPHASMPHNPLIAEPLFLTRIVEKAGSGILDMIALCAETGLRSPEFRQDAGSFVQTLWRPIHVASVSEKRSLNDQADAQVIHGEGTELALNRDQVGTMLGLSRDQEQVLMQVVEEKEIAALMNVIGRSNRTKFRDQVLNPLIDAGFAEMTIPDKPKSSLQKYRITEKGRTWLAGRK